MSQGKTAQAGPTQALRVLPGCLRCPSVPSRHFPSLIWSTFYLLCSRFLCTFSRRQYGHDFAAARVAVCWLRGRKALWQPLPGVKSGYLVHSCWLILDIAMVYRSAPSPHWCVSSGSGKGLGSRVASFATDGGPW